MNINKYIQQTNIYIYVYIYRQKQQNKHNDSVLIHTNLKLKSYISQEKNPANLYEFSQFSRSSALRISRETEVKELAVPFWPSAENSSWFRRIFPDPSIPSAHRNTLQEINISHLGKRKIILGIFGGYVSSLEGIIFLGSGRPFRNKPFIF